MAKENQEEVTRKLQQDGIETDGTISRQFIKDMTLGECLREIQKLMEKWELRPLERDVLIMLLRKFEDDRRMKSQVSNLGRGLGETIKRLKEKR